MTMKAFLGQAYNLDKRIETKLEQIDALRSLATRATSTLTDMPRSPSPDPHRTESVVTKIADLSVEAEREIDKLVDLKREISSIIEWVENPEQRLLLELRYLGYQTWDTIAQRMGYSNRRVLQLHKLALESISFG